MTKSDRISTGIPGLDAMLDGGFLPQTANLIEGAPGCGKSTFGMQFIYEGAQRGEPGLLLTFEEFPQHYYRDAASFGWDFRALEERGLLKIVMSSPEVSKADMERVGGVIQEMISEMGAKHILIDSITHFEYLSDDAIEVRDLIYSFLNALKRQGLTTLLTRETPYLLGEGRDLHPTTGIHFLVDTYVMLRYVEIASQINRAIVVLKMRGSTHDTHIRRFEIDHEGMKVLTPFEGQEGLMSGTPTRMAQSFIKAFVRS